MNELLAAILIVLLSISLRAAPPSDCSHVWMERHGYGHYIHDDDQAKAQLLGRKLDPDWSPHIMDDPGGKPAVDWCDRIQKALQDHPPKPPQSQGKGNV
jgi:hypothetical protein